MTKTIIAIGGGEIGRIKVYEDGHREQKPIETMVIDKKIIELTGKEHPTLVFIGAASGDNPAYFTAVKNHFENRLGVKTINLNLTNARPTNQEIKTIIMNADIVYIGGGNVTRLMKVLKESETDKILIDAYNKGIIMSGNSAGGCVWFEYYDNDEDEDFDGTESTFTTKKALAIMTQQENSFLNVISVSLSVPFVVAIITVSKSLSRSGKTTCVSGSPKRQLYSITFGPSGVSISPK